jgi:hypothetical protein
MLRIDVLEEFEKVTEELYQYVLTRDNGLCQICGKMGDDVHHIIHKGHGGKNMARNLTLLCKPCHMGKFGMHGCMEKSIVETLLARVLQNEKTLKGRIS